MVNPVSSSLFATALGGLLDASERMEKAAEVIAKPESAGDTVTLSEAAVALKEAELAFKANAKVLSLDPAGWLMDPSRRRGPSTSR